MIAVRLTTRLSSGGGRIERINNQPGVVAQLRITEKYFSQKKTLNYILSPYKHKLKLPVLKSARRGMHKMEKSGWKSSEGAWPHLRDYCSGGGDDA